MRMRSFILFLGLFIFLLGCTGSVPQNKSNATDNLTVEKATFSQFMLSPLFDNLFPKMYKLSEGFSVINQESNLGFGTSDCNFKWIIDNDKKVDSCESFEKFLSDVFYIERNEDGSAFYCGSKWGACGYVKIENKTFRHIQYSLNEIPESMFSEPPPINKEKIAKDLTTYYQSWSTPSTYTVYYKGSSFISDENLTVYISFGETLWGTQQTPKSNYDEYLENAEWSKENQKWKFDDKKVFYSKTEGCNPSVNGTMMCSKIFRVDYYNYPVSRSISIRVVNSSYSDAQHLQSIKNLILISGMLE